MPGQGGGGAEPKRLTEDPPGADKPGRGRSLAKNAVEEQFALGVVDQNPESLLGLALDLGQQVAPGGPGRVDFRALEDPAGASLNFLEDRESGHLCLREAEGLEFGRAQGGQPSQALDLGEDLVSAPRAGAVQHDLDNLRIRDGLGTMETNRLGHGEAAGMTGNRGGS